MTVQKIVERVKQTFPNVGYAQILEDANRFQREFCVDTGVLHARSQITIVVNTVEYTLPTDVISVYQVDVWNADSKNVDLRYNIEVSQSKIKFFDRNGAVITTLPNEVTTIYLRYFKFPTALVNSTDSLSISTDFEGAVLAKLASEYHGVAGNEQKMEYWERRYERLVQKGLKHSNTALWSDSYSVQSYEMTE